MTKQKINTYTYQEYADAYYRIWFDELYKYPPIKLLTFEELMKKRNEEERGKNESRGT